jgi:hypothetical protein
MLLLKLVALVVLFGTCYGAAAPPVVRALSGSEYRTCALLEAGVNASGVKCWGGGVGGQVKHLGDNLRWAPLPASFSPVGLVAVSGTGYAWDAAGRLVDLDGNDTGLNKSVTQVCQGPAGFRSVGSFTCALQAGRVRCWGQNDMGQLGRGEGIPNVTDPRESLEVNLGSSPRDGQPLNASSIWCGSNRVCAVVEPAQGVRGVPAWLRCWGAAKVGGLLAPVGLRKADMGEALPSTLLAYSGEALDVVKVALIGFPGRIEYNDGVSRIDAIALLGNGSLWAIPPPGDRLPTTQKISTQKSGIKDFCAQLDSGLFGNEYCYVLVDGQVECSSGRLLRTRTVRLGTGVRGTGVHCGAEFVCVALASGGVKCAGGNAQGELGSGDLLERREPFQLGDNWPLVNLVGPPVPAVRSVHVASSRSCAVVGLANATVVRCWGDGERLSQTSELGLDLSIDVAALALGDRHACALGSDRVTLKCWGDNSGRQVSIASSKSFLGPGPGLPNVLANETDQSEVLDIAVTGSFSCVFRASGLVTCWGGASATSDTVRTWKVGLPGASSSEWERGLVFAARKDGALCKPARVDTVSVPAVNLTVIVRGSVEMCCWTGPGAGMADIVAASDGWVPVGTTQIANHDLALVGDKVKKLSGSYVPFLGDGRWSSIAADATSAVQCGVRAPAGGLHCWGLGSDGRLGLESNANLIEPVVRPIDFGSDRSVYGLAVGPTHSCARLDNGEVKCWGGNERYQLGLSDNIARGAGPGTMGDRLPAVQLLPGDYVQSTSRPSRPTRAPTTSPTEGRFEGSRGVNNSLFVVGVGAIVAVAVAGWAFMVVAGKIKARRTARAGADSTRVAAPLL